MHGVYRERASILAALFACWVAMHGSHLLAIAEGAGHLEFEIVRRFQPTSGGAEISDYSAAAKSLFVAGEGGVSAFDFFGPSRERNLPGPAGFVATSVACSGELVAAAWAAKDKSAVGALWLYDATTLASLGEFPAGHHPDMATFTPDGRLLLAANEGEPAHDYSVDPPGSITLVDLAGESGAPTVRQVGFARFNAQWRQLHRSGVLLQDKSTGHGVRPTSVEEDLEPEYLAVGSDSQRVWATLQENNAIAEIDLQQMEVTAVLPLGMKDFSGRDNAAPSTGLDPSDRDGGPSIDRWPIRGLYQPDAIAVVRQEGEEYLITANEGDPRAYLEFNEGVPAGTISNWDSHAPGRLLLGEHQLGRLEVFASLGDADNDGDADELIAFGARSFAIWRAQRGQLELVYESGNELERRTSILAPDRFNSNGNAPESADFRSPFRGPEPEGLAVGRVDGGRILFVGLERQGGVLAYEISDLTAPVFCGYLPPGESNGIADAAPEGLLFVSATQSPVDEPLLIVSYEASGTVAVYRLRWR